MSGMKNRFLCTRWFPLIWLWASVAIVIYAIEFVKFTEQERTVSGREITCNKHPITKLCPMSRRVIQNVIVINPAPHKKLFSPQFNFFQINHTNLYWRTPFFSFWPDEKRGEFFGLAFKPQIWEPIVNLGDLIVWPSPKTDVHNTVFSWGASTIFKYWVEFPSTNKGSVFDVIKYRFVLDSFNEYMGSRGTNQTISLCQRSFSNTFGVTCLIFHKAQLTPKHEKLTHSDSGQANGDKDEPESEIRKAICLNGKFACIFYKLPLILQALIGIGIMLVACFLYFLSYCLFDRGRIKSGAFLWLLGFALFAGDELVVTGYL